MQINYISYVFIHTLIIYIIHILNHIMMKLPDYNAIFIKILTLIHNILDKILDVYCIILSYIVIHYRIIYKIKLLTDYVIFKLKKKWLKAYYGPYIFCYLWV